MAEIVMSMLRDLISPVRLLSLNPESSTGKVSGRFRSGQLVFDYLFDGERINYGPIKGGQEQARRDGLMDRVRHRDFAPRPFGNLSPRRESLVNRYGR